MAEYRADYKKQQELTRKKLDEWFGLARETARQGAEILCSQFEVQKVVVFGSLTNQSQSD